MTGEWRGNPAPGPWTLVFDGDCLTINDAKGNPVIADWDIGEDPGVGLFCDAEQEVANFILMSEAPAMLQALKGVVSLYKNKKLIIPAYVAIAQNVVARAERTTP